MGIRRVVLNIIERADLMSTHTGIPCIPVIVQNGIFQTINPKKLLSGSTLFQPGKSQSSQESPREKSPGKTSANSFASVRKIVKTFKGILRFVGTFFHAKSDTVFHERDLLLLPDAFWGQDENYLDAIRNHALTGVHVVLVIHDIIPFQSPDFYDEKFASNFQKRTFQLLPMVHGILCVSRTVMNDVEQFLNTRPEIERKTIPIDYFYLGADFKTPASNISTVRSGIRSVANSRLFLSVGTIEPRKNPLTLVKAFDRFTETQEDAVLVIAGKLGYKGEEIMETIRRSSFWNKRIFVWNDVSDAELEFLYQNASALVFPSLAEGFGIPLIEAINRGVPVVASDLPIFREIGKDHPTFFQPGDTEGLTKIFCEMNTSPHFTQKQSLLCLTWDEAALGFIDKALSLYRKI